MKEGTLAIKLANDGGWEWDNIKRFFYGINKKKDIVSRTSPFLNCLMPKIESKVLEITEDMNQKLSMFISKQKQEKQVIIFLVQIYLFLSLNYMIYIMIFLTIDTQSNLWFAHLDIKNIGVKPYCSIEINYSHSPIYIYH